MRLPIAIATAAALILTCRIAAADAPSAVVIGWSYAPDVPQIAQAVDKNLWKDQALDAKIIPFSTGRDSFEALIGGQLDLAIMAEFPPVSGAMRNLDFSVVAVLAKYTAARIIVKSPTPVTLQQLAGKKIGTPVGTNVHFDAADPLGAAGVKAEFINVGPSDLIPALVRGDIDAASMFPSAYEPAKKALGAQYQQIMLPNDPQIFILLVSQKLVATKPEMITRVLKVLLKGEELLTQNPQESQEATARYTRGALTVDQVKAQWPEHSYKIELDQATLDMMVREAKWELAQGYLKEGNATKEVFMKHFMTAPLQTLAPDRVDIR